MDIMKFGHQLLCDCGQPLNEYGVCTSCNPPEEREEEDECVGFGMEEREAGTPRPLDFNQGDREYEEEPDGFAIMGTQDFDL